MTAQPTKSIKMRNRREPLLDAAASQFLAHGYAAASMRAIAVAAQMKPASIYYHFPSKMDLLVAVHERGLDIIHHAVAKSLVGVTEPWARLEAACVTHLEVLLGGGIYFKATMREPMQTYEGVALEKITHLRDGYEQIFAGLLDELPLPEGTNRHDLRLMLLGSMNWSFTWYRHDGDTPAQLARKFIGFLRSPLNPGDGEAK